MSAQVSQIKVFVVVCRPIVVSFTCCEASTTGIFSHSLFYIRIKGNVNGFLSFKALDVGQNV